MDTATSTRSARPCQTLPSIIAGAACFRVGGRFDFAQLLRSFAIGLSPLSSRLQFGGILLQSLTKSGLIDGYNKLFLVKHGEADLCACQYSERRE